MTRGFSLWLDALRVLAALMVLLGHVAHVRFTDGALYGLRSWNVAADFVIVFFVLSGVVIAYAAERDGTLGAFAFNRLTRLWSVLLPAILLTIVLDRIGVAADPSAYPPDYFRPTPVGEMLLRGLTFSIEWSGLMDRVRLGSNGPIWSLSYEAAFYTMFGIAVFLRGMLRIAGLALTTVLVGIPILALLPAWLMGVYIWRRIRSGVTVSDRRAWLFFLGGPIAIVYCKLTGVHLLLADLTAAAFAPADYKLILAFSDEALWNTLLAFLVALHLVGAHQLAPRIAGWLGAGGAGIIRWMAGASFTLYVVHYPVLHLADAILPEDMPFKVAVFIALPLLVTVIFAELFERPLPKFRAALKGFLPKATPKMPDALPKR